MNLSVNNKTVNLKMKRIDVCDLLIALDVVLDSVDTEGRKWVELHDKIREQLDAFDEKQNI